MRKGNAASIRQVSARVIASAKEIGLEVSPRLGTHGTSGIDIEALAPSGTRWAATETHSVVAEDETEDADAAWDAIGRDIEGGLEPCPIDCHCREGAP